MNIALLVHLFTFSQNFVFSYTLPMKKKSTWTLYPHKTKSTVHLVLCRVNQTNCNIQYFLNIAAQLHPIILGFLLTDTA